MDPVSQSVDNDYTGNAFGIHIRVGRNNRKRCIAAYGGKFFGNAR